MASGAVLQPRYTRYGGPTDARLTTGTVVTRLTAKLLLERGWIREAGKNRFLITPEGRQVISRSVGGFTVTG